MSTSFSQKLTKTESLEEFEFLDVEGDLDVDLSKSPIIDAAEKMSSGIGLILSALITVTEEQGLVVSSPAKALAVTAVGAVTGSLIGGPPGLAVGLLTGAVVAITTSPNRSKSPKAKKSAIREVFSQMTMQQKKELLKELVSCLKQSNVRVLVYEILKNEKIRSATLNIVSNFLLKKMGLCLTKP